MSAPLAGLALLMGLVTYPARLVPLLAPGLERLPRAVRDYLRLVGPAVLAALAVVNVAAVTTRTGGPTTFHVGIEWLALAACVALVTWRRNLFIGLAAAVVITAALRAAGAG